MQQTSRLFRLAEAGESCARAHGLVLAGLAADPRGVIQPEDQLESASLNCNFG
jgi:hypothetical protein